MTCWLYNGLCPTCLRPQDTTPIRYPLSASLVGRPGSFGQGAMTCLLCLTVSTGVTLLQHLCPHCSQGDMWQSCHLILYPHRRFSMLGKGISQASLQLKQYLHVPVPLAELHFCGCAVLTGCLGILEAPQGVSPACLEW
jgi:hypothetical protein